MITVTVVPAMRDGTVTAPGWPFIDDPDTGFYRSGANALDIAAGGVRVATLDSVGLTMQTAEDAIVPAALTGTPVAHGVYRANVIKAWAHVTLAAGAPTVAESFNITGITDNGVGNFTLTLDRDFATLTYCIAGTGFNAGGQINITPTSQAAGTCQYGVVNSADTAADVTHEVIFLGGQ